MGVHYLLEGLGHEPAPPELKLKSATSLLGGGRGGRGPRRVTIVCRTPPPQKANQVEKVKVMGDPGRMFCVDKRREGGRTNDSTCKGEQRGRGTGWVTLPLK